MKLKRYITKVAAIVCILVFSQKMGAGLYLHNILHNDYKKTSSAFPNGKSVRFACNCIDDFTMPFTETNVVEFPVINVSYIDLITFYRETSSFTFQLFYSLRAPPVIIA